VFGVKAIVSRFVVKKKENIGSGECSVRKAGWRSLHAAGWEF
jgi:hypothetical protein